MGVLVMVLGPSGSGKSTSLLNLAGDNVEIFSATGKRLPFRTPVAITRNATYRQIYDSLKRNESLAYVIDDSTYLMQLDNFARVKEKGYDKFTQMARSFQYLLEVAAHTSEDTAVYFLHHPQFSDGGESKPQTIGKMLDNQLCIEGLFDLVLQCVIRDGEHMFVTNHEGIAKSPMGMLEPVMKNDLGAVDAAIREFWTMEPLHPARTAARTKGGGSHAA